MFSYSSADVDNVASSSARLDGVALINGGPIDVDTLTPGTHTITITVTDVLGNTRTASFTFEVHASSPSNLISAVNDGVSTGKIAPQQQSPLNSKLTLAQTAIAQGNYAAAKDRLQEFIGLVVSQSGKKIDAAYAALLIAWANDLIARLP
jgi:hypothetical protein